MKERPILFSAPMVRALLAGTKTQTRRIVKGVADADALLPSDQYPGEFVAWVNGEPQHSKMCPYGVPGDVLWVRENFRAWERPSDGCDGVVYEADVAFRPIDNTTEAAIRWLEAYNYDSKRRAPGSMVPCIHMPRWASRISLGVTEVRVERLNEISEADAKAEGLIPTRHDTEACWKWSPDDPVHYEFASSAYRALWEHINGPGSWAANPWVWAVSFERV